MGFMFLFGGLVMVFSTRTAIFFFISFYFVLRKTIFFLLLGNLLVLFLFIILHFFIHFSPKLTSFILISQHAFVLQNRITKLPHGRTQIQDHNVLKDRRKKNRSRKHTSRHLPQPRWSTRSTMRGLNYFSSGGGVYLGIYCARIPSCNFFVVTMLKLTSSLHMKNINIILSQASGGKT